MVDSCCVCAAGKRSRSTSLPASLLLLDVHTGPLSLVVVVVVVVVVYIVVWWCCAEPTDAVRAVGSRGGGR